MEPGGLIVELRFWPWRGDKLKAQEQVTYSSPFQHIEICRRCGHSLAGKCDKVITKSHLRETTPRCQCPAVSQSLPMRCWWVPAWGRVNLSWT